MRITVTNNLTLEDSPFDLKNELQNRLTLTNPKWEENEKQGYWNGDTARLLKFYEQAPNGGLIIRPRGYARQLLSLCERYGVKYQLVDKRRILAEINFRFKGKLRPFQVETVEVIGSRDFGTLPAPTGSGKTVMALWLIAHRKQPALIVVHTKELLNLKFPFPKSTHIL